LDCREIRDKFEISTLTACMKVNKVMHFVVCFKIHIISKLQKGRDFQ